MIMITAHFSKAGTGPKDSVDLVPFGLGSTIQRAMAKSRFTFEIVSILSKARRRLAEFFSSPARPSLSSERAEILP